ncbi:MAG TPA: hypothetical protein VH500_02790 [Nitrososphaeraceae archaeon]
MFGNGEPLLVLNGAGQTMNDWPPSLLKVLSSDHIVIMFDARGIGNIFQTSLSNCLIT